MDIVEDLVTMTEDLLNEIVESTVDVLTGDLTCESSTDIQDSSKKMQNYLKVIDESNPNYKQHKDVQDFEVLRDQCLKQGILFEDPYFELSELKDHINKIRSDKVDWLRPKSILEHLKIEESPRFIVDGATRFDINQRLLSDSWFVAATANLTLNDKIFNRVVPNDQEFDDKYAGIFHFRFWRFDKWVDVVVDDRLPTIKGRLMFTCSTATKNEFWIALLEKAYAKCCGESYEILESGYSCNAMVDFTGGISQRYILSDPPLDLFDIMYKAYLQKSLLCCGTQFQAYPDDPINTPQNLLRSHVYTILKIKCIDYKTPDTTIIKPMLKLRNPWGFLEWNGRWNDKKSLEVETAVKNMLNMNDEDDGEFWIEYDDFIKYFSTVEICYLINGLDNDQEKNKIQKWSFEGKWIKNETAGGSETLTGNPKYSFTLEDIGEKQYTVDISLMNKTDDSTKIAFTVLKDLYILDNGKAQEECETTDPSSMREVSRRLTLTPGTYDIVTYTLYPNEEGEFFLRVFSQPLKADLC